MEGQHEEEFFVVLIPFTEFLFICISLFFKTPTYTEAKNTPTPTPTPTVKQKKAEDASIKSAKVITKALKAAEKRKENDESDDTDKTKITYNYKLNDLDLCYASFYMFYREDMFDATINKTDIVFSRR